MTYQIIRDPSIAVIETSINTLLADGWSLYGDLIVTGGVFYQAMTYGASTASTPDPGITTRIEESGIVTSDNPLSVINPKDLQTESGTGDTGETPTTTG